MDALERLYPDLRLPRAPLGRFPTRVHRLESPSAQTGCDLWVKRDDETAARYGGNKVRKLEWLLGEARERGARRVLTLGAAGSHHVLATGLYARAHGIETTAVLVPQPATAHVGRNVLADLGAGIELVPARSDAEGALRIAALSGRLTLRDGAAPYTIMVGGSSALGTIGFVAAGIEFAEQVRAGACPAPEVVFVPLGSGSTVAGLLCGLRLAGLRTDVVGVRVTGTPLSGRRWVTSLARRARALLAAHSRLVPEILLPADPLRGGSDVLIDSRHLGRGYGHPTPEGDEATRLAAEEGITLDPTYTAKTFAAMMEHARARKGRTMLYWHTLSSADIGDLVELGRGVPVPTALRRYVALV